MGGGTRSLVLEMSMNRRDLIGTTAGSALIGALLPTRAFSNAARD